MIANLRKALALFSPGDRRRLALLLGMMVVMAAFEALGVASIMPFMAVVARPEIVHEQGLLAAAYGALGFESTTSFLVAAGLATLATLIVANAISALTNWMLFRFTYGYAQSLARRLLGHYMGMPYEYFLERNTTTLAKNVVSEVHRLNIGLLLPALQMLARGAVAVLVVSLLVAVDPWLALAVALASAGAYALLYAAVRRSLLRLGRTATAANDACFRLTGEALSGIKDIRIAGREREFVRRFAEPSRHLAGASSLVQAISLLPRYALETIAFGGILAITLYLITGSGAAAVIPTVALYAFAGYRLMPALQQVYASIAVIRFNVDALHIVHAALAEPSVPPADARPLPFERRLSLRHLDYAYPGRGEPVLRNLSLDIDANTTVAITGPSGAGKTTLIDVLLGLLPPTGGSVLADGTPITPENVRGWQRNLGYVPQQIHLSDDTLEANVAFGVPPEAIDRQAVERALRLAHLDALVASLPQGLATPIGERGIRLSGGQRQRIGIARALYGDPKLLILDEATSALDGLTESAIMDAIRDLAHRKTIIIIAHRLSTVQECDVIHLLDRGEIVASGTYGELMQQSDGFRALAGAAAAGELP